MDCKKLLVLICLVVVSLFLSSCRSSGNIQVSSMPPGAHIKINGRPTGKFTPILFPHRHASIYGFRWGLNEFAVELDGYTSDPERFFLNKHQNQVLMFQLKEVEEEKPSVSTAMAPPQAASFPAERRPVARPRPPVISSNIWQPSDRQHLWVLSVGISRYENSKIPVLPYAKSDARRFRDWFANRRVEDSTKDSIHVLYDEQATLKNLLSQIDWLRRQALPEDSVIVYFACHGAPELDPDGESVDAKYLLLHDTDPDSLFATGFSFDELNRRLDVIKAKVQVVVLEACYLGEAGKMFIDETPTADLEIRHRAIQNVGEKSGRVILSASSGSQMAIESKNIEGGLFTHHLLQSWGDGDKGLLSDTFNDARYQVRRSSNQLGSYQEPAKFGDPNVDLILKAR